MAETRGCIKLEMDESNYSSFVPVIGMYIAGVTLVCLLAMVYDNLLAFRHKKVWLPCQLFSFNSLTLTLIGIAAKLPLDLTTPMPSGLDQFSKLCGNSFICISMGIFMPSLGLKQKYDGLTNLLSLIIFVVTLIVNTYVQIRTGVIFLFRTEHVIIICCMLTMLWPLSKCYIGASIQKEVSLHSNRDLFRKRKGTMLQRLKLVYLYAYNDDPQIFLCTKLVENCEVAVLCIICSAVLLQAAIRNLSLIYCGGRSDYGLSVWATVLLQILTFLVGSFASIHRSWGIPCRRRYVKAGVTYVHSQISSRSMVNALSSRLVHYLFDISLPLPIRTIVALLLLLTIVPIVVLGSLIDQCVKLLSGVVETLFGLVFKCSNASDSNIEKYKKLIGDGGSRDLQEWGLIKSVKDMEKCMEMSKSKSMEDLAKLLITTRPSRPFHRIRSPDQIFGLSQLLQVSSLSMAVLVKITEYSLPLPLSTPLVNAYTQVSEIIHYINDNINVSSTIDKEKSRLAKVFLSNHGIGAHVHPHFANISKGSDPPFQKILEKLMNESKKASLVYRHHGSLRLSSAKDSASSTMRLEYKEMLEVMLYVNGYSTSTKQGIHESIQQLFVDMLHMFLTQVPHVVYKVVTQSTAEEFYESVQSSIGILRQIKSLEAHFGSREAPIRWSFPVECDSYDLATPQSLEPKAFFIKLIVRKKSWIVTLRKCCLRVYIEGHWVSPVPNGTVYFAIIGTSFLSIDYRVHLVIVRKMRLDDCRSRN